MWLKQGAKMHLSPRTLEYAGDDEFAFCSNIFDISLPMSCKVKISKVKMIEKQKT